MGGRMGGASRMARWPYGWCQPYGWNRTKPKSSIREGENDGWPYGWYQPYGQVTIPNLGNAWARVNVWLLEIARWVPLVDRCYLVH